MPTTTLSQSYSLADHEKLLAENPILLYMKGTPAEPLCGFSDQIVRILQQCNVHFQHVDVLNPDIRAALKQISQWPTFPQLYIKGELMGGSNIVTELYKQGKLQEQLKDIAN
jgi:monothiol glutaredoxin